MNEQCCFNTIQVIYHLYHGKNKLHFNDMMLPLLYWTNTISWIFIVLPHWNISHIDVALLLTQNLDFEPTSLLLLIDAVCLGVKQQTLIIYSLVWPSWGSNAWFTALQAGMLSITSLIQFKNHGFVTIVTQRVPLVEQELSIPSVSEVCVAH